MCSHNPARPPAEASGHPDHGSNPICHGTVVFGDTGEPLPDGCTVHPRRCAVHPQRLAGLLTTAPQPVVLDFDF